MERSWFVLSPRPFRELQAIEAACDRAVDAFLEENPDCEDTFGEVAAIREVPDEAAVKKAVTSGTRTGDIAFGKPSVGTKAMADAIIAQL